MVSKFHIRVDSIGEEIFINQLNNAAADTKKAVHRAAERVEQDLGNYIGTIMQNAAGSAGPEAFPIPYAIDLLNKLQLIRPKIAKHFYGFDLLFDFHDLGTYDDLSKAFHYHARLKSGDLVELPWTQKQLTGALKNSYQDRLRFWEAMRSTMTINGNPISGALWNRTISERVAAWGDKAPQWLLLQYGQSTYPQSRPFPILEQAQAAANAIGTRYLAQELYQVYVDRFKGRLAPAFEDKLSEHKGYLEAGLEPDLVKKAVKLGQVHANYFAQINADESSWMRFMNEALGNSKLTAGLSEIENSMLRETFRRLGGG